MTLQNHTYTPAILLIDIPPSILCGIDLLSFTTSPRFLGIKDLPPGFHFIFTSETSSLSLRDGFWFHVPQPNRDLAPLLIVCKWDSQRGCLTSLNDTESYRAKLTDIWDTGLSPYRQRAQKEALIESGDWDLLTTHVTPQTLRHLSQNDHWSLNSAGCATVDQDDIPGLNIEEIGYEERKLGVLGIDLKRTWPKEAVGRERTDAAIDRTWALEGLVKRWKSDTHGWGHILLGQMEVCFIMILTLANYSCLEEWKRCLNLVLTCRRALREHEQFFVDFLVLLRKQIERCEDVEGGLFDMTDEGGSLLKSRLKGFKQILGQAFSLPEGEDVKEEMEELEQTLSRMYDWNLTENYVKRGTLELEDGETVGIVLNGMDEEEDGEYAPVIVELDNT
ncbi:uncharacterized protein KY384_005489 [Bacidia gigantensis]|uniref:uncharacterized protein n=1 Tax=Bacidia gigantensis TaxID=2732470 RepID=UPI001D054981|nr:uncharacterized protein KY384_005489 [Bacidia gigantensis]KAG8530007.1 hypothetical protein KY384_005489 [Bacidia gigantensis]